MDDAIDNQRAVEFVLQTDWEVELKSNEKKVISGRRADRHKQAPEPWKRVDTRRFLGVQLQGDGGLHGNWKRSKVATRLEEGAPQRQRAQEAGI